MYWLRWHYHVKDIAGAPYKIKQKQKGQKCWQSVLTGRQRLYCAVQPRSPNHSWTMTEKVVFGSQQNVVSDGVFLTDDGRLFHTRAEATAKAWSPSFEHLVDGTTSIAVSAERRRRQVLTSSLEKAPSKVRRRSSMKTAGM